MSDTIDAVTAPPTVDDILSVIETNKREHIHGYWCPSLQRELGFLPLNTSHQKELVRSIVDGPFTVTRFNLTIYEILKQIITEPILDNLTTLDKRHILIGLRADNVSTDYTVEHEDSEGNTIQKTFNLQTILKKHNKQGSPKPQVITVDDYTVETALPTFQIEREMDIYAYNQYQKLDENNPNTIKTAITIIYITQLLQYIRKIQIKDQVFDFQTLPTTHKLQVGNMLPSAVTQKIIKTIDNHYGPALDKVTSYKFTKDGDEYTGDISIDNAFMLSD